MSFIESRAGRGGGFAALAVAELVGFTPTLAPRPAVAAEYVDAGTLDLKPEERAAAGPAFVSIRNQERAQCGDQGEGAGGRQGQQRRLGCR
jgi:hypothetical protein